MADSIHDQTQTIETTWWAAEPVRWPPDDQAIFAAYEQTQPGYELIAAAVCEPDLCGGHFEDAGGGYLRVCLWKMVQDHQAGCGRGALDEQPEHFALPGWVLSQS